MLFWLLLFSDNYEEENLIRIVEAKIFRPTNTKYTHISHKSYSSMGEYAERSVSMLSGWGDFFGQIYDCIL